MTFIEPAPINPSTTNPEASLIKLDQGGLTLPNNSNTRSKEDHDMSKNTNTKLSASDFLALAGENVPEPTVIFEDEKFNLTAKFRQDPWGGLEALQKEINSIFDLTERAEEFRGYTVDELAVALDKALHQSSDGVPQVVSWQGMDLPSSRRIPVGYNWKTGSMQYHIAPDGYMSIPMCRNISPNQKACIRVEWAGPFSAQLRANIIRGDEGIIEGLFALVRQIADSDSIYRGQVVDADMNFVDMTSFKPENVSLTGKQRMAMNLFVAEQHRHPADLDKNRQNRKTAILAEGPPGGGKTMFVSLAEYTNAMMNGVSIHVSPEMGINGLERANTYARRLLGAGHVVLIAMEDIEKLAKESRPKALEILDGAGEKNLRRITIGTTNFIETIDRAMLRPGRFDTILHCGLPDLESFTHLLKVLIREDIRGDIDYEAAFPHFEGYSYAMITAAVSVVIRDAIATDPENIQVTTAQLIESADLVRGHHNLLQEEPEKEQDALSSAFLRIASEANSEVIQSVRDIDYDHTDYDEVENRANEAARYAIDYKMNGASVTDERGDVSEISTYG